MKEDIEVFRPISEEEFLKWISISKEDGIKDLMENFNYTEEIARKEEEKIIEKLLPEGIETDGQEFYTYEKNGISIGYVWLSKEEETIFIFDIMVLPEYQKIGYGKKMMKEIIKIGIDNEIKEIELRVSPSNEKAIKLYNKLGFKITGYDMYLKIN